MQEFESSLKAVTPEVYHFRAKCPTAPYLVWAEDGQGESVHADGMTVEQSIEGTVDYFTRQEYDPNFQRIQVALDTAGAAWRLNSIQYEDDTGLIHYEWVWQVG